MGIIIEPRADNEIDWRVLVEESEEDSDIRANLEDFKLTWYPRGFKVRFSQDGMELIVYDDKDDRLICYWAETELSSQRETQPKLEFLVEGIKGSLTFHIGAVATQRPKQEIDWRERVEEDPIVHNRFEEFWKLWHNRSYQLEFSMDGMMLKIYRADKDCGSWWAESVLGERRRT